MGSYLIYSPTTGVIDRTGGTPDGDEMLQALAGEAVMLTPGQALRGDGYYVDLGPPPVLVTKPPMGASINKTTIAANGIEQAIITSIPVGATLYIDGVVWGSIDDGQVEFSHTDLEVVVLELQHPRYLPQQFRVAVGITEGAVVYENVRILEPAWLAPILVEAVEMLTVGG
jgi:hypothetical protein